MKLISKLAAKSLLINLTGEPDRFGGGVFYPMGATSRDGTEELDTSFESYVQGAYKRNGIVFACIAARQLPFSEARFQVQEIIDGRRESSTTTRRSASSISHGSTALPAICCPAWSRMLRSPEISTRRPSMVICAECVPIG